MSGNVLTVPPPRDDDHDDVAWALRAASAQWRREATVDAVGWVRRAAETAEEIGAFDRAAELNRLANDLSRGPVAIAPPPPPGARASDVQVEVEEVEIDDLDEIEELEGFEEIEDVDDVEDADEIIFDDVEDQAALAETDFGPSASIPSSGFPHSSALADSAASSALADSAASSAFPGSAFSGSAFSGSASGFPRSEAPPVPPSSHPPEEVQQSRSPTGSKRSTTSSRLDMPPSMRPSPSGLDLAEDSVVEEEFGELEFQDESPTNPASLSEAPPIPDLGGVRMDLPSSLPLERSTAAEYATSQAPNLPDHDEIERELGVNLSLHVAGGTPSVEDAPRGISAPPPPDFRPPPEVGEAAPSFGMSRVHEPPPSSVQPPLGAYEDPFGDAVSPVPGRASVRPSQVPSNVPIQASAESEPYGLAPSAQMPPATEAPPPYTPIEPPSSPYSAPHEMEEPEERPSVLPGVSPPREGAAGHGSAPLEPLSRPQKASLPPGVISSAPDLEEFDDMFDAISRPPPKPERGSARLAVSVAQEAPAPPNVALQDPSDATEDGTVRVDGVDLMEIRGLQDLPEDSAIQLGNSAQIVTLAPGEEVSSFGVALVTHGAVQLMPTVADATCAIAGKGEVLFTKGTLDSEVAVRVVGHEPKSRVALFTKEALEEATSSCPWVADELAEVADRYLAFAGAVLGPLGDSLDDMFRFMVLDKCEVKSKAPGTIIAVAGKPMDGMYILGGGTLEIIAADGSVQEELGMGDFLFPETILSASPAAATVRVGEGGALVLYAARMAAHELLATCPPFIELLAGG